MRKPAARPSRRTFFVAIEKDPGSSYGVVMPDFPGCTSGGDTIPEARANAVEAIEGWIETSLAGGDPVYLTPSPLAALRSNPDYAGAIWKTVTLDAGVVRRAFEQLDDESQVTVVMAAVADTRGWEA
jgi:predicted RNase H-like HicB family nuclease